MLSFTPVSGKEEGKRRKECEGSREAATMLSTQRLLSVPSSPSPELPESFQNCQVAEDEAPHLHQATNTLCPLLEAALAELCKHWREYCSSNIHFDLKSFMFEMDFSLLTMGWALPAH